MTRVITDIYLHSLATTTFYLLRGFHCLDLLWPRTPVLLNIKGLILLLIFLQNQVFG